VAVPEGCPVAAQPQRCVREHQAAPQALPGVRPQWRKVSKEVRAFE